MTAYTLFAALLVAAPGVKEKAKPADAPPTGEWIAERVEQGGQDVLPALGGRLTMTFRDGTAVMRIRDEDHSSPVTFDPTAKVKGITLRPGGRPQESRGVYKIEGDTLTINLNEKPDGERPTDFAPGAPGHTLFVLKRAKD